MAVVEQIQGTTLALNTPAKKFQVPVKKQFLRTAKVHYQHETTLALGAEKYKPIIQHSGSAPRASGKTEYKNLYLAQRLTLLCNKMPKNNSHFSTEVSGNSSWNNKSYLSLSFYGSASIPLNTTCCIQ